MYLLVQPIGLGNAIKLYFAYGTALVMKILRPRKFRSIGHLIPGKKKVMVQVAGIRANIRPGTSDLGMIATVFEPKTAAWFQVEEGDVVVDIGAHIGRFTLASARKASIVVAIEPVPSNFSILKENVALNGFKNVIAMSIAISDREDESPLYLPREGDTATSSLEPTWSARLNRPSEAMALDVECRTLDSLVASLDMEVIHWLKIDVEGHEVPVLKGGESALRRTKNLVLEVTAGNEELCKNATKRAGLELVATEMQRGTPVSNWLLSRK